MSGGVGRSAAPPSVPLTRLVGREREVAELVGLLGEHRLVTGPGGCGKTRLAVAVAAVPAALPPGGVCWVELAAARLRVLSVDELAQRLVASYAVLTGGSRTALPQ